MPAPPSFVVHPEDLDGDTAAYPAPFDTLALGRGRDLGSAAGSERLGAWRETLQPGQRTGRLHAHLLEEEAIVVLSGHPVLHWRTGEGTVHDCPLRPGHFVSFPAGTGIAHALSVPEDAGGPVELLVLGERHPADRVAFPADPELEAWRRDHRPGRVWEDAHGPGPETAPTPYRIETPRLVLHPFEPIDTIPLVGLLRENHRRLQPWFPWAQQVPTVDQQLEWIRGRQAAYATDEDYTLGVYTRQGQLVGGAGIHLRQGPGTAEFGYWVGGRFEGLGLVSEWVAGLTRLCLERLGFEQAMVRCDTRNHRSRAVPERLGYTLDAYATMKDATGLADIDVEVWQLRARELARSPAAQAPVRAWDGAGRRML